MKTITEAAQRFNLTTTELRLRYANGSIPYPQWSEKYRCWYYTEQTITKVTKRLQFEATQKKELH
jgi:hypothetical protein